jgi:hypothetical protein
MALPWLAVGKLVLANLDTLVGVARPLLTREKADSPANEADVVHQQISELQVAAVQTAERLQQMAAALEQVRKLALAALAIALVTLAAFLVSTIVR